jgi:hypothetical protein
MHSWRFAVGRPALDGGAHARRHVGVEKVDVEAHMQVGVGVERGERELHRVAHAHLVDVAHVEDLEVHLVARSAFRPASTLRMPIWRIHFGLIAGTWPPISISSCGPWPHRHATGMPCRLPLGREDVGVEVGMRVEPQDAQLLVRFAAVARHRADRAEPRQWSPPSRIGRRPMPSSVCTASCTALFHGHHLVQVAVTVGRRQPGVRRAVQVAEVDDLQAMALQHRHDVGHPQGLGAHAGAAHAGADVGRRADDADLLGHGFQMSLAKSP